MKKGQIIEGTVERIDFPNKGIVVTEEGPAGTEDKSSDPEKQKGKGRGQTAFCRRKFTS